MHTANIVLNKKKAQILPSKIRHKIRLNILIVTIQYSIVIATAVSQEKILRDP